MLGFLILKYLTTPHFVHYCHCRDVDQTGTTSKANNSGEETLGVICTSALQEMNSNFNSLQGNLFSSFNETKDTSDNDEIQDEEKGIVIVLMVNTASVVGEQYLYFK